MATRKRRQRESTIPEVNLVPMMDVLMTVLTFFIIISMNLTSQTILSVETPEGNGESGEDAQITTVDPLVVGLNTDGEILISDEPVDQSVLREQMQAYYANNPEGYIRLKADRELEYSDVNQFLITLRNLGGGRVSLAYE